MTTDSPKLKRRFLQFGLRTFFVLMTLFAVWFGWAMNKAREQANAVAWVREMGGSVRYEYEVDEEGGYVADADPPAPDWLRAILGVDFVQDVVWVNLDLQRVPDAANLRGLKRQNAQVKDVKALAELDNLEWLSLQRLMVDNTQVNDLAPLGGLTHLQWLGIANTQISNLTPLAELESVKWLSLQNTQVNDLAPLTSLRTLIWLHVDPSHVTALKQLAGFKNLELLYVYGTQFSKEQVDELQETLPNCRIHWPLPGANENRTP